MIGIDEIIKVIPHRPPFLLLDRVSELVPRKHLTAHKMVTGAELRLSQDTSPFPAPLLVESWAQAALVLLLWEQPNPDVVTGLATVVGTVEGVRFGDAVRTGQEVEHRVTLVRRYGDMSIVRGSALVGDGVVLEVDRMVAALRPAAALVPAPDPTG